MRVGRIGYVNCYPVYAAIDSGPVASPPTVQDGDTRFVPLMFEANREEDTRTPIPP